MFDVRPPPDGLAGEIVDVADAGAVSSAVRRAMGNVDRLSGVVTAAGVDACGPLADVGVADWERVVAVNLLGTAAVVRSALAHLRRDHGRVVTVASTLGVSALPDATAYCASKFGIVGFTRALAAETAGEWG